MKVHDKSQILDLKKKEFYRLLSGGNNKRRKTVCETKVAKILMKNSSLSQYLFKNAVPKDFKPTFNQSKEGSNLESSSLLTSELPKMTFKPYLCFCNESQNKLSPH